MFVDGTKFRPTPPSPGIKTPHASLGAAEIAHARIILFSLCPICFIPSTTKSSGAKIGWRGVLGDRASSDDTEYPRPAHNSPPFRIFA